MSFKVNMTFTLNNTSLQMTLTFEHVLVEYKPRVELWNFIHLTLIFEPMILVLKLDLAIAKGKSLLRIKFQALADQKFSPKQIHRQTHRLDWNYYLRINADGKNGWHLFTPGESKKKQTWFYLENVWNWSDLVALIELFYDHVGEKLSYLWISLNSSTVT